MPLTSLMNPPAWPAQFGSRPRFGIRFTGSEDPVTGSEDPVKRIQDQCWGAIPFAVRGRRQRSHVLFPAEGALSGTFLPAAAGGVGQWKYGAHALSSFPSTYRNSVLASRWASS